MRRRTRQTARLVLIFSLYAAGGCGSPTAKLVPVSGTVTRDGQPLAEGTVYFKTPQTGAFNTFPVKDGKFEGTAEVGDRRVEITAYRVKVQDLNGMKGEMKESLVPDRYNLNSTLAATVTPDGPNTYTFEVKSK